MRPPQETSPLRPAPWAVPNMMPLVKGISVAGGGYVDDVSPELRGCLVN